MVQNSGVASGDWRKTLPAQVKRDVRTEAGWRCAMPRCGQTSSLEIHHIVEHAKGGPDTFENLILLCAVCHGRITKGEIDRKSVRQIKTNLGLLNARYNDIEQRVLRTFRDNGLHTTFVWPPLNQIMIMNLIADGVITDVTAQVRGGSIMMNGQFEATPRVWALTDHGCAVVERWSDHVQIEDVED